MATKHCDQTSRTRYICLVKKFIHHQLAEEDYLAEGGMGQHQKDPPLSRHLRSLSDSPDSWRSLYLSNKATPLIYFTVSFYIFSFTLSPFHYFTIYPSLQSPLFSAKSYKSFSRVLEIKISSLLLSLHSPFIQIQKKFQTIKPGKSLTRLHLYYRIFLTDPISECSEFQF